MTKGKFYLGTGIGHCGTQWLANALHCPPRDVYAIHEGARRWRMHTWKGNALHYLEHGIDRRFDYYFAKVDELLRQYRVVVDTHSWIPSAVPEVAKRVEVSGVIHLVRNGIQNVHSLYETDHTEPRFWFYSVIKREAERVVGFELPELPELPEGGEWAHWCAWWAANVATARWLVVQGLDVRMYRLEDLTTSYDDITLLTDWLGFELPYSEIRTRQARDWNRHISGDRTPIRLLAGWSQEQRETFLAVCSEMMRHLGYF